MLIVTPVPVVVVSTSSMPRGSVPSPNSRLPGPTTTGNTSSTNSSTRSWRRRVWMRSLLPDTWISPPEPSFSFATSSATSPDRMVVLAHSARVSVCEATYLGMPLSLAAIGSSSPTSGQLAANSS
ncbi:hypothetical protein BJF90_38280 [Pseudonocardia sp. CNS-004]|nr:hypothetical protein BJF90_38280 [Pseudonocardia sp. CNS-004]